MGAQSKLIVICRFEDLEVTWLNYDPRYYNFTKLQDTIIYNELINCETTSKSEHLMNCFRGISSFDDFANHLIYLKTTIDWEAVDNFDKLYEGEDLKEKLNKLVGGTNIVMFIPNF